MPEGTAEKTRRQGKNPVDPFVPYHFLQEEEPSPAGILQQVNTIFLSSKECSFQCLMCDLWKNTLPGNTPHGAIPIQMDYALGRLPQADVIKLYNSGNFFDRKAVPPSDYFAIAKRAGFYQRIIVENHPLLCNDACLPFRDMLNGKLEIAMGLETIHPEVLPKLNKQLTPADFNKACRFLNKQQIDSRAFILFNPPFLTDPSANLEWSIKSIRFAFECGVTRCSLIPTRPGTVDMDALATSGAFVRPGLHDLEEAYDEALRLRMGQVFVDTWDLLSLSSCPHCFNARKLRLERMNREQTILPQINCPSCSHYA